MPALSSIVFAKTTADGRAPTVVSTGVWMLKFPANAETINADSSADVDFHQTVTIPVGYFGIILSNKGEDVVADPNLIVHPHVIDGTGSPASIILHLINVTAGPLTPDVGEDAARLIIVKPDDFKQAFTGSWNN